MRAPLVTAAWRLGLILLGFAAATLVAALSTVAEANAQERPRPAAQDDWTSAYETRPQRGERASDRAEADVDPTGPGSDAAPADSFSDQDDQPPARSGESADAGAEAPLDGAATSDGLIDLAEPAPLEDGGDPIRDTRPPEDAAVFESPPAGYDPLLFQIEDVDPTETDRRPARLARFEPYDPIGIRIGSFVFFPETEIGGLWTDNVLSSPDAQDDIAAEIRSTARLVSNWSTHALELKGTSLTSFHDDYSSEDDRAWGVEARGRLDVTRRTNLQAIASHNRSQESRSAIDANQVGDRADVTTDLAQLALNHRFNRLSVQLRGSVSDTTYSDTDNQDNADRNTLETKQAARAAWQFKPTLAVFAEHELNQRDKETPPADGIRRDSTGHRTRLGLDLGSTGAVLRGEISVGYGRQTPDDGRLASIDAFLLDANLAWRPSEVTSFLLTAQSDIYDTTTTGSGGVVSHTVGLEARHALRRYVIASAGLTYTRYDYDHSPIEESATMAFVGGEYYASPELVLFTRYQHLSYASNQVNADYESDEIRVGARIRR